MKDRITQFLKSEGISPAEFADKIGVQRSSVSHVLNGRNYPSASFIQKMLGAYKRLNSRWLLLGEGVIFEAGNIPFKEPSLFHASFDAKREEGVSSVEKTAANLPKETVNQLISVPVERAEPLVIPNQSIPINLPSKTSESNNYLNDNKEVDRIVYFFKDKTFEVYTPSK